MQTHFTSLVAGLEPPFVNFGMGAVLSLGTAAGIKRLPLKAILTGSWRAPWGGYPAAECERYAD